MKRTTQQNSCLHSYCSQLAESFNDIGLDMRRTLRHDIDIPWTMETVKEYMFNFISLAMYDKTSSELDTIQMQKVYETLNRHTSDKHGIGLEWPDKSNKGKC